MEYDETELEGLTEEEKKLVKSGKYEPYNFEEEELEDDDYFFEDKEDI